MSGLSVNGGSTGEIQCRLPFTTAGPLGANHQSIHRNMSVFALSARRNAPRTLRAWLGRASRPGENPWRSLMKKKIDPVVDEAIERLNMKDGPPRRKLLEGAGLFNATAAASALIDACSSSRSGSAAPTSAASASATAAG